MQATITQSNIDCKHSNSPTLYFVTDWKQVQLFTKIKISLIFLLFITDAYFSSEEIGNVKFSFSSLDLDFVEEN